MPTYYFFWTLVPTYYSKWILKNLVAIMRRPQNHSQKFSLNWDETEKGEMMKSAPLDRLRNILPNETEKDASITRTGHPAPSVW